MRKAHGQGDSIPHATLAVIKKVGPMGVVDCELFSLLSAADIPILILDVDRRIRHLTPTAGTILNIVPSDVVGRSFDDSHPEITRFIDKAEATDSEVQDRHGHWYRLQVRPSHSANGQVDGAILYLVDIDRLKHDLAQAEEEKKLAENANRAKDQLLAMLSHELRTPVTTVLLLTERLRRARHDAKKLQHVRQMIEQAARSQLALIDALLDGAGLVVGKIAMVLEDVDLVEIVEFAVEAAALTAVAKPVQLTVTLDKSLGTIQGNRTRLQQMASNLLSNALKFTPAGGGVKVVLARVDGRALFQVSDSGCGMEPNALPHVFERSFQEDNSATGSYRGLGLGLAIARDVVELHGGTIGAESAGKGRGATFSVSLPIDRVASR